MILQALVDLAEAEGLVQDPDFEPKDVHWIVQLTTDGKLAGIVDARRMDENGRARPTKYLVPKTEKRAYGVSAQFLYEKSDYVFGVKIEKSGERKEVEPCLDAFIDLVVAAFAESGDEALGALHTFMQSVKRDSTDDRVSRLPEEFSGGEWFTFQIAGDQGLISDRPAVRDWWKSHRRVEGEPTAFCLVTGAPCVPVEKHDGIKRVPGGSTADVSLVSFNRAAYESYGLERNENAAVGRTAEEAYVRALNRLLDPAWPSPTESGAHLPRRSVRLGADSAVVFWERGAGLDFANLFDELLSQPDPQAVQRLFTAPRKGTPAPIEDQSAFYALTLSGGQGRATIRDWLTCSVGEAAARLAAYFGDLELAFPFEVAPRPSLPQLLQAVALHGEMENISPNLASAVLRAILQDSPFPITLLHAAIHRCKAEGPLPSSKRTKKTDWSRAHLRMQVIKACQRRIGRARGTVDSNEREVLPMLDDSNTQTAYLLGRLFAALAKTQEDAQPGIGGTIGDRFYGAASSTPNLVFARLFSLSRHHLAKLRRDRPGQAVNRDKLVQEIMSLLPPAKLPPVLSLEEQGLFAIGFYHQRNDFFRRRNGGSDEAAGVPEPV